MSGIIGIVGGAGSRSGVIGGPNAIGFSGYLNSNITSDGVVWTYNPTRLVVQGVTESSGTVTLLTGGTYWVHFTMMTQTSSTAAHWVSARCYGGGVQLFASTQIDINLTDQTYHQPAVGGVFELVGGDTVYVNSSFNGTNTIFGGSQYTRFSIFRIGA